MLGLTHHSLVALGLVGALATLARAQDSLSNGDVREVTISLPEGTRIEYFRLDLPSPDGRRSPPVGVARWITGADPGATVEDGKAWRSELELVLFAEKTRVVHTERISTTRRELVFRELRDRSGRTVRFVWTPDQKAVCTDASGGEVRRREFDLRGGAALPLTLVDVVRRGGQWHGDVRVFEPLAAELDLMTPIVTRLEAGLDPRAMGSASETSVSGAKRVLELWRADGLNAGSYRFDGEALVSFAWQAGGPVATAIPADEFERWRKRGRPVDAALSAPAPGDSRLGR